MMWIDRRASCLMWLSRCVDRSDRNVVLACRLGSLQSSVLQACAEAAAAAFAAFIYKYQTRFHGTQPAEQQRGEEDVERDRTRMRLAGWNMAPEFS